MGVKPLIGLNADFRAAKGDSPAFSYVWAGYFDAISAAGGVPLIIPPLVDDDDLNRVLDLVEGVIMVGGADLDPRRDGFMLHPAVRPLADRREERGHLIESTGSLRRDPSEVVIEAAMGLDPLVVGLHSQESRRQVLANPRGDPSEVVGEATMGAYPSVAGLRSRQS